MNIVINLNGKLRTKKQAQVSIFDHGFLYGDSVYETLITYQGKPFCLDEHIRRLFKSAKAIHLKPSWSQPHYTRQIKKTIQPLWRKKREAIIRITLTRGVGAIGLDPSLCKKPTNIILAQEFKGYPKKYYTQGIHIWIVNTQRNAPAALNPAIKSGNFLNNILAFIEAQKHGAFDGIMLNHEGHIAEGTTSNIFIIKNNILKTPQIETGILEGITRDLVFRVAKKAQLQIQKTQLKPKDIYESDECFITSTTKEIMPVTRCNKKKIGHGYVGPVTQSLLHLYRKYVWEDLSLH